MDGQSSEINWSEIPKPLSSALFDKYTHQSIFPPLESLDIDESIWNKCRSFALNLGEKYFDDPLSILYTSFKRLYPNCPSIRSFSRWLSLRENNRNDFKNYFKQYSIHSINIQSIGELVRSIENLQVTKNIPLEFEKFQQIWFFFSISIRISFNDNTLVADNLIVDDGVTRLSGKQRKGTSARVHCLFALTPSGKFSNQLFVCKQSKCLKMNFPSSTFAHIVQTSTGDITVDHVQQWLENFISLSYGKTNSAILIDPRTTLLTPEFESLCEKSNIELLTIDLNNYLTKILTPIFSLIDKKIGEINRFEKMFLKSSNDLKRIVYMIWCSLRTLKQNEEICQLFNKTSLWRNEDNLYTQSMRSTIPSPTKKKKKKKSLVKSGSKSKLPSTNMMNDPPVESTPEQILSYVIQRQLSISRASKFLGGMKLDYLKYCLSYKSNSSLLNDSRLLQLNTLMQSESTVDWLRRLRSLYFWSCAKQLFLREVYELTGIITRKRSMNMCANGSIGSIRCCDLQSPGTFWRAFEDIHQIQFDNETTLNVDQWHDNFQQYLIDNKLNNEKTQLWTIDTFEFPLTKKSAVLQLPEWNELRPMNLTPKVTIVYAFSSVGQSIEPSFIFPISIRDNTITDQTDSYNELGHLTPQIFHSWIQNNLRQEDRGPIVLIFCSSLAILSPTVLSTLEKLKIYPYGYPHTRTLPFRYLFERRVRNNRSTNLMSELWKKKLLDEQRTHVLKGSNLTVENIKYYFHQIWSQIIYDKYDDDENGEQKTFEDRCQQAFQQGNIEIKMCKKKNSIKLMSRKGSRKAVQSSSDSISSDTDSEEIIQQLNHLLNMISHFKEQISSANSSQILKINNHIQECGSQLATILNGIPTNGENHDSELTTTESVHSNHSIVSPNNEKRSIDENDEPHISKRLRSSCSQPATTVTSMIKWNPPSKQHVTHLLFQSSSLFQFTLSLIRTIFNSTDPQLTDEHSRWLHSTLNLYGHNYNNEKINVLIETACKVAKISLIR